MWRDHGVGQGWGGAVRPLLAGMVIGAGVALLLAPASGVETREALRRSALRARRRAQRAGRRAGDAADAVRARGREAVHDLRERAGDAADEARSQVRVRRRQVRHAVDAARAAARGMKDDLDARLADVQRRVAEGPIPG